MSRKERKMIAALVNLVREESESEIIRRATDFEILEAFLHCALVQMWEGRRSE